MRGGERNWVCSLKKTKQNSQAKGDIWDTVRGGERNWVCSLKSFAQIDRKISLTEGLYEETDETSGRSYNPMN